MTAPRIVLYRSVSASILLFLFGILLLPNRNYKAEKVIILNLALYNFNYMHQ